jgi:hypothetical protein
MEMYGTSEAEILARAIELAAAIRDRAKTSGKKHLAVVMTGTIGRLEIQRSLSLQQVLEPLPPVVEHTVAHYEGD